jgi:TP901-1 family phage major tail protein
MAAQKGRSLLMKVGSGSPVTYTTIGGMRSTSIAINDETVDVTNKDSGINRVLLANGGITSMAVSGSGVFTDSATEALVRTSMAASSFSAYQFLIPDFGTYTGTFQLVSLEYAGEYNGEVTYSFSFESSGAITFATV